MPKKKKKSVRVLHLDHPSHYCTIPWEGEGGHSAFLVAVPLRHQLGFMLFAFVTALGFFCSLARLSGRLGMRTVISTVLVLPHRARLQKVKAKSSKTSDAFQGIRVLVSSQSYSLGSMLELSTHTVTASSGNPGCEIFFFLSL